MEKNRKKGSTSPLQCLTLFTIASAKNLLNVVYLGEGMRKIHAGKKPTLHRNLSFKKSDFPCANKNKGTEK